jgi:1-acyl-sn-glycerol-3-phosphate acyltransferase
MADPNPAPGPEDLFDPSQLDAPLLDLIGPGVAAVVAAASSGNRHRLRRAERAWADAAVSALHVHLTTVGLDLVDPEVQYVVAPLHEGFADVLALLQLPLDLSFIIRDELLDLPYFGEYLQLAGHIAVEPELPRAAFRALLREVPTVLERGDSLVVFPQGTLLGIETKFQPGAFQLADRFGLSVLPVALSGSHQIWDYPFDRTLNRGQSLRLEVLDPVPAGQAMLKMADVEAELKSRARRGPVPVRRYVPERDGLWEGYRFELEAE